MTSGFHLGYFAVGAILFGRSLLACSGMRRIPFVPAATAEPADPPRLTAIVLAGGDLHALAACVDDLVAQRGCTLDVIVAVRPGGSAGDQPAMTRLCAGRSGVRVVEIPDTPADAVPWNVGFAAGAAAADPGSTWLLLLERPYRLPNSDSVRRAVAHAVGERADLLWLLPRARTPAALTPSRLASVADAMTAMAAANRDRETVHWPGLPCIGRRELIDGTLRDPDAAHSPAYENLMVARLRAAGQRARYAFAAEDLDAGRLGGADLAESVERLLAAVGFRFGAITVGVALFAVVWGAGVYGAVDQQPWGWFAFVGLASQAIPAWLTARATCANPLAALVAPFAFPLEAVLTVWLALRASARGTVRWRGRTLTTASLRAVDDTTRP